MGPRRGGVNPASRRCGPAILQGNAFYRSAKQCHDAAVTDSKLRLPLVLPGHELSGAHPRGFERAARTCQVGDAAHRALLFSAETIAARCLDACLPPSPRGPVRERLALVRGWATGECKLKEIQRARADTFDQAAQIESATLAALAGALESEQSDPLDRQGALTVTRYVARGVHHAVGSVLFVLDAVTEPTRVLRIAEEAAGAMAFVRVALGGARSGELRAAAREQAAWEAQRLASNTQPAVALSLQLYHEYIGALWKDHADAQRAYFEGFLEWVFGQG